MKSLQNKGFGAPKNSEKGDNLFKSIEKLVQCSNHDTALKELENLSISANTPINKDNIRFVKLFLTSSYYLKDYTNVVKLGSNVLTLYPNDIDVIAAVASAHRHLGHYAQASDLWRKSIKVLPKNGQLYYNYANCLSDEKKFEEALTMYSNALNLTQAIPVDWYKTYINLLNQERKYDFAIHACTKAYETYSNDFNIGYLYVDTLRKTGKHKESVAILRTIDAKQLSGKNLADYYFLSSAVYEGLDDTEKSIDLVKKSIKFDPTNIEYRMHLAHIYQTSGDREMAREHLEAVVKQDHLLTEAHRRLTVITKYNTDHPHYQELNNIYANHYAVLPRENQKQLHFALAKAEEDAENYTLASSHLIEGNKIMDEQVQNFFNLEAWMNRALQFLELDRHLCKSNIQLNRDQSLGQGLIFIVGMPRSGSTLVENILTMAPHSVDLGEIAAFQAVSNKVGDLINQSPTINQEDLNNLSELYFENINKTIPSETTLITDKNLYNWRYAGLIAHCFPSAKIIHCVRNPLDNMLSIFKALFPLGNEYAFNLDSIYKVYQLHDQCMRYYKQRHPEQVITSNYDDLVSDPEKQIKQLIKKIGLEWNESFLRPQDNRRKVKTASSQQVRESIHKKSLKGWKRFDSLLAPYAQGFAKLGYDID